METKICSICGEEKPLTEFNFRDKRKGTYRNLCKNCLHKIKNERYQTKYKERYKDKLKHNKQRHRELIRSIIAEFKLLRKCYICLESESCCLDFHHLRDKEFEIGHSTDVTVEKLMKEIDKCVLLCANCHRKLHAGLISL